MNITVIGTKIKQDTKTLAFEKNNNVDVINITVDTDESWGYKLDVKYPICRDNKYNIINLERSGNTLTTVLTAGMLPFAGKYLCQLRGINGDKVYHTDTFEVWVKYSIEPGETYRPIPSEFYQIEENITEMNNHPPYPSDDGYWMIWNVASKQYEKSDIQAATGQGAVRYDIAQELTNEQQTQARENITAVFDDGEELFASFYNAGMFDALQTPDGVFLTGGNAILTY